MDRRSQRHLATRKEILDAAWSLARDRGLAAWSMRDLAQAMGMRAPSLYVYFPNKDAIFDAMFADGYAALLELTKNAPQQATPRKMLRTMAYRFFDFAMEDTARLQLMFWRVIPGFEPTPEAYAVAVEVSALAVERFASIGINDPDAFDIWIAIMNGYVTQQAANEPDGTRWREHIDTVVDMFADRFLPQ
jgi:AcrR family transcriptional regulator